MLRNSLFLILLLALALFPSACGTQEKRPSQDVLLAKDAFVLLDRLRNAYSARDMNALESLCTGDGYASLRRDIKEFRSVTLEFQNNWVNIKEDGTMEVQVAWSGKWTLSGEGPVVSDRGKAVFVISGRVPKLLEIQGLSPFAGPSGTSEL